ncbi:hypothetical protein PR048_016828, partial [Dryococelus australis]
MQVKKMTMTNQFPYDVSPTFPSQISSVKIYFKGKLVTMIIIKEFVNLLIVEHSSLSSTYPEVCTTVPVTVDKAELSFSKLKL